MSENPFEGLGNLGSLGESTLKEFEKDKFSDLLHEDVSIQPGLPIGDMVEPPPSLPCNHETMECMRGPCIHMWQMVVRIITQAEIISIQRAQNCAFHRELQNLADENVFVCGQWWPQFLAFVPMSARPILRPILRDAWEKILKIKGATFDWRWWPKNVWDLSTDEISDLRRTAINKKREELKNA